MKKFIKLTLASAVASVTLAHTGIAFGAIGLEEIVVTARKREESIQDVPVAVTAVTGETFERSLVTNFQEATALTPGFSVMPSSTSPHAPSLSMRGSVQNATIVTADPSVGVYVDGVYIARAYGVGVDFLDLRDLQVLKGPQGTLFGRNSTAGALLLNTNNPELGEFTGSASLTGGNHQTGGQVILNVPLGEMFAFRVAHQQNEFDDYITNAANDPNDPIYNALEPGPASGNYSPAKTFDSDIGGYDNETTRAKLLFAPTDALEMVLSWEQYESDLAGPARDQVWISGITIDRDKGDDRVSLSFDPRAYAETETTTFVTTHSSDLGELKFIASTREYRSLNEADYDGGDWAAKPADVNAFVPSVPPGMVFSQRRHGSWGRTAGDQDSLELQFVTSLLDDRLDLTTGVTYFEEEAQ